MQPDAMWSTLKERERQRQQAEIMKLDVRPAMKDLDKSHSALSILSCDLANQSRSGGVASAYSQLIERNPIVSATLC